MSDYNGWTNYPTWAVNLWLANDEGLYIEATDRAEDAISGYEDDQISTENVVARFADSLSEWVQDDLAPDLGASFAADLLGYALDQVVWYEIAESWIGDALENRKA